MNFGGNIRWVLLIGGILICAVCALLAIGGNLLSSFPTNTSPVIVNSPTQVLVLGNTNDSSPVLGNTSGSAQLSQIVMARNVGEGNEPIDQTSQFRTTDGAIYAVTQGNVSSGTRLFARWSRDGTPFEDTSEIVADRDYQNTYIEFHISPNGAALTAGNYTVQIFVNGNPGPQAQFTVS